MLHEMFFSEHSGPQIDQPERRTIQAYTYDYSADEVECVEGYKKKNDKVKTRLDRQRP